RFIEGRSESGFARESRGLEFLLAAVIFNGDTNIRGYDRESETIRDVMKDSLREFRNAMPHMFPSHHKGDNLSAVKKDALEWESKMRKAASAA
ncbi:MAG: hypothetical protein P0S93_05115, partial [Candidatus Neptunochlamydia sp.]|nr:hypothetical protein [Candidatus Neptunochlamydia sp.]